MKQKSPFLKKLGLILGSLEVCSITLAGLIPNNLVRVLVLRLWRPWQRCFDLSRFDRYGRPAP
jgi:hypothetical protein